MGRSSPRIPTPAAPPPPPKRGPLPASQATAAPGGDSFQSNRTFSLDGVTPGQVVNPAMLGGRSNLVDRIKKVFFGGSS
jgi:hypothetical protein